MTVFICGNSHVRALRAGAVELGAKDDERLMIFPLGPADNEAEAFSAIENGRVVLTNNRFRNKLQKNFGFSAFDPAHRWGICLGTHNARIFRDEAWLHAAPAWLDLPGLQPVSEDVFAEIVAADQVHVRAFLEQLIATGVRPFVISAPWPVRTHPIMTETGVRPEIVQAIDRRARALFADWLADRDIPLIAPPAETADDEGFLLPEYAKGGDDPYHGNAAYGRLMLTKVINEHMVKLVRDAKAADAKGTGALVRAGKG